jgi:hypothetical protein
MAPSYDVGANAGARKGISAQQKMGNIAVGVFIKIMLAKFNPKRGGSMTGRRTDWTALE